MMLPQARPTPIIGTKSHQRSGTDGIISMPSPPSVRHTACTRPAPKRRVNGTMPKAAMQAMKL